MRLVNVALDGYDAAVAALKRTTLQDNPSAEAIVRDIVSKVRAQGDKALLELGRRFDSPLLNTLEIPRSEWTAAAERVPSSVRLAMQQAASNIRDFHEKQRRTSWMDAQSERITGQLVRPLQRVGVYVPGGTASYPSTVLMTALPAKVAGVEELILCTPAQKDGGVSDPVLFAALLAGVDRVFCVGGAQAIAALAFGTETIPAVDKIVGPGNIYVNIAKKLLWGVVDMDMLAGPSEVCVVADAGANPKFAALDLLTQAEHDIECAAYLVTPSAEFAQQTHMEIDRQLASLPRQEILKQALDSHGVMIVTESLEQAYDLANVCAPEHLALMVRDPFAALGRIRNAGAILMGDFTPQTLGDYMAGPSHTLPTSGTARFASPLNVDTFLKKTSFIYYTAEALSPLAASLVGFACAEGFDAHAQAVTVREEKQTS